MMESSRKRIPKLCIRQAQKQTNIKRFFFFFKDGKLTVLKMPTTVDFSNYAYNFTLEDKEHVSNSYLSVCDKEWV